MFPDANHGVFKGKEFPRLMFLLAILVIGWPVVLWTMRPRQPPPPPPVVSTTPPLPPPDDSLEFRGIQDRAALNSRETPAYKLLIERVRKATPKTLEDVARRDVVFSQLIEDPERYRGLPIHIVGTVRRVLTQEVKDSEVFPSGTFYEAYVFTPDSQSYPYDIVFEKPPADLMVGDNINQRITFNGYFFKLMAYRAADKLRFMPMLVGRSPAAARADATEPSVFEAFFERFRRQGTTWVLIALSIYFVIRILFTLRKALRPKTSPLVDQIRGQGLPPDHIEPDALADFLSGGSVAPDDGDSDEKNPPSAD
jgi:hypothetical protein